ncbi:MAG: ABC transporter permease [Planctomycetes bacterium]|nr:ABC transporter permease [Planctomycetota bacterium]
MVWKKTRSFIGNVWLVYLALALLLAAAQWLSPGYLSASNLMNVLRQGAFLGIVAIGQTLVIITAGTDLSVSYLVTLGNLVGAQIMAGNDGNVPAALAAVIAVGAAAGLANGAGVHYLKIPSLIMTLGVGSVLQGAAYLYSKGAPKGNTAPFIKWMVTGQLPGGISPLIALWIILAIAVVVVLHKTTFGRNVYAVGKNPLAAYYAGVPTAATLLSVYVLSGVLACLTGMLLVGYTGTSFLSAGNEYQMNSIAAVVIGGTLLSGGAGGYGGTIGGTLILCVLLNILNIVRVPVFGREIIRGGVIILLLIVYSIGNRRK